MFPGFSEILRILLRDRPCLELIIVSSNYKGLLLLYDKLLESVWKVVNSSKNVLQKAGPALARINSVIISARTVYKIGQHIFRNLVVLIWATLVFFVRTILA